MQRVGQVLGQPVHHHVRRPVHAEVRHVDRPQRRATKQAPHTSDYGARLIANEGQRRRNLVGRSQPHKAPDEAQETEQVERHPPCQVWTQHGCECLSNISKFSQIGC